MADKTKITLSKGEVKNVQDTQWILTKYSIIKKVYELFNARVASIKNSLEKRNDFLSAEIILALPKINKGENYRQFPYVIMDFPAVFSKQNVFALRTMFWWGNFFSVTLHLSGTYKDLYAENIINQLCLEPLLFYVCINETEWQHSFETDNYLAAKDITNVSAEEILKKPFIKLALKYDLRQWNNMPQLLDEAYEKILNLLKN